jgi:hypothetical protein
VAAELEQATGLHVQIVLTTRAEIEDRIRALFFPDEPELQRSGRLAAGEGGAVPRNDDLAEEFAPALRRGGPGRPADPGGRSGRTGTDGS